MAFPRLARRTRQFCALATVAAIVAGGVAWNRHLNAAPTFAIPAPAPLPNPNAFDDFVRAAALHREPDTSKGAPEGIVSPAGAAKTFRTDSVFADNAAAVQALHVGFTHPFQMPSARSGKVLDSGFKYFSQFRSLARTLGYETQQRAARGDAAGAMETGLDGVQMGVMLPRGGDTYSLILGTACEAVARKPLWAIVGKLDATQAAGAARRLETIAAQRTSLADTMREEEWRGVTARLELLQKQSVTAALREIVDPENRGNTSGSNPSAHPFRDWLSVTRLSKQQVIDDYAAWMNAQIVAARPPYSHLSNEGVVASSAPADLLNQTIERADTSHREVQFKDASDRADDGLLTTLLALRAYRLKRGDYPASLDALVTSGTLHALPADPFARSANAPFGYRRLSGDGFRLYSVGPDGVDDGGRPIDLMRPIAGVPQNGIRTTFDSSDKGDWVVGADAPAPGSGAG